MRGADPRRSRGTAALALTATVQPVPNRKRGACGRPSFFAVIAQNSIPPHGAGRFTF